jgi:hypothetical protein
VPDWAIVLIAAFGGGLAGAVLQPITSYAMDRLRASEQIRKSHERTLRRMIESKIEAAQRVNVALHVVWGFHQFGSPAPPVRDLLKAEDFPISGPVLTSDRIADPELGAMAAEYSKLTTDLVVAVFFQELDAESVEKLLPMTHRLSELEKTMIRRMDQLNWPPAGE